jgi:hypothetical protein
VALSCGSPRLAASQHPALWSPDLPRPVPTRLAHVMPTAATRPARSPHFTRRRHLPAADSYPPPTLTRRRQLPAATASVRMPSSGSAAERRGLAGGPCNETPTSVSRDEAFGTFKAADLGVCVFKAPNERFANTNVAVSRRQKRQQPEQWPNLGQLRGKAAAPQQQGLRTGPGRLCRRHRAAGPRRPRSPRLGPPPRRGRSSQTPLR